MKLIIIIYLLLIIASFILNINKEYKKTLQLILRKRKLKLSNNQFYIVIMLQSIIPVINIIMFSNGTLRLIKKYTNVKKG